MYSDTGNTTSLVLGFPIRTSSDPRSVGSSPRHIAASHVLHRPLMPRHPPCALKHLQHKTKKMSHLPAHTIPKDTAHGYQKNLHYIPEDNPHKNPPPKKGVSPDASHPLDARNHYPRIKHHTPPPSGATTRLPPHTGAREPRACCLRTQQCVWQSFSTNDFPRRSVARLVHQNRTHYRSRSIHRIAQVR